MSGLLKLLIVPMLAGLCGGAADPSSGPPSKLVYFVLLDGTVIEPVVRENE